MTRESCIYVGKSKHWKYIYQERIINRRVLKLKFGNVIFHFLEIYAQWISVNKTVFGKNVQGNMSKYRNGHVHKWLYEKIDRLE